MKMNRRSTLIGLGALVTGAGGLFASGAFTTVEADRTVSIETADDANAFLALTPGTNSEYVNDDGDTIEIQLDSNAEYDDGTPVDGSGLNQNARNRFEDLVEVTNNGTQDVTALEFNISVTGAGSDTANNDHENAFKIISGGETFDATGENVLGQGDNSSSLTAGGTPISFGVEIDLTGDDIDEIDTDAEFTLRITAGTGSS